MVRFGFGSVSAKMFRFRFSFGFGGNSCFGRTLRVDSGDPNENLPNGWIRCDGGVIPNPSIWEGCHTLDLNGKQKFLRGGQDASVLDMEDDMVQGDTLLFDFVQS